MHQSIPGDAKRHVQGVALYVPVVIFTRSAKYVPRSHFRAADLLLAGVFKERKVQLAILICTQQCQSKRGLKETYLCVVNCCSVTVPQANSFGGQWSSVGALCTVSKCLQLGARNGACGSFFFSLPLNFA